MSVSVPETKMALLMRSSWNERLIYGLLFLFPIAGVSVNHWFSGIYAFLAVISLVSLFQKSGRQALFKEERIWSWLCIAFFASFLVSALANGWSGDQNDSLGINVRYLLAVPLLLMLRRYRYSGVSLLLGGVVAAFMVAGQAYYDIYYLGMERATGFYNPNLLGQVSVLLVMYLLAGYKSLLSMRWLLGVAIICGFWAAILSGSRGGYLGLMAMVMTWSLIAFSGKRRIWMFVTVVGVLVVAFLTAHEANQRFNVAFTEINSYFQKGVPIGVGGGESSAIRFEMWRAAWMSFLDHPVLGTGDGNYKRAVQSYIDRGLVNAGISRHDTPHNAYLNALMSRGVFGYLALMGVLFYPLFYFIKTRRQSPQTALLGIVHIVGFAIFSLADNAAFERNNFSSVFLLYTVVFLAWHAGQVNMIKEKR